MLKTKLEDLSEHAMVRHEAAEALGAINQAGCEEVLRRFEDDASQEARLSISTEFALWSLLARPYARREPHRLLKLAAWHFVG